MRCVIPLRPIFWRVAEIFAPSRNCLAMPAFQPRRSILLWIPHAYWRYIRVRIREREIRAFARLRVLLVWLCGLIFWAVLPASSQEESCGVDLVAGRAQQDPATFEQGRADAEAIPNGRGLLGRRPRAAPEPSCLFGTLHLCDERIVKLPERAEE